MVQMITTNLQYPVSAINRCSHFHHVFVPTVLSRHKINTVQL